MCLVAVIGVHINASFLVYPVDWQLRKLRESLLTFPTADTSNSDEDGESENVNWYGFVLSDIAHLDVDLPLKDVVFSLINHLAAKHAFLALITIWQAGVGAAAAGICLRVELLVELAISHRINGIVPRKFECNVVIAGWNKDLWVVNNPFGLALLIFVYKSVCNWNVENVVEEVEERFSILSFEVFNLVYVVVSANKNAKWVEIVVESGKVDGSGAEGSWVCVFFGKAEIRSVSEFNSWSLAVSAADNWEVFAGYLPNNFTVKIACSRFINFGVNAHFLWIVTYGLFEDLGARHCIIFESGTICCHCYVFDLKSGRVWQDNFSDFVY